MIYKRKSLNVKPLDEYIYFVLIDGYLKRIFINESNAMRYVNYKFNDSKCNVEYKIKRMKLEYIQDD